MSKIHHRKFGKILVEDFVSKKWRDLRVGWTCSHWRVNWGLCVALHASKIMIHVCRLVEKKFALWWWIKKKMTSVFFEAHQYVFTKIHHAKLGKILVEDFETKMCSVHTYVVPWIFYFDWQYTFIWPNVRCHFWFRLRGFVDKNSLF